LSSITPSQQAGNNNTAYGYGSLESNSTGFSNVAIGEMSMASNTNGMGNTSVGWDSLSSNTTGFGNTAIGIHALQRNVSGTNNVAFGGTSLRNSQNGVGNTAVGNGALYNFLGGSGDNNNVAIGQQAGINLTGGNSNIYIGSAGPSSASAESATIRIGEAFQASNYVPGQTSTYIAGIYGVAVSGSAVYINSSGQLGVAPSSERYKEDIRDIGEKTAGIYSLRPVSYQYKDTKKKSEKTLEYGLIAEEVDRIYPELVERRSDGRIESVKYNKLVPMLLNEIQKLKKEIQALKDGKESPA
jgi:hypothetical protein